ncbi:hypothetical protein [Streptomyces fagopyri]
MSPVTPPPPSAPDAGIAHLTAAPTGPDDFGGFGGDRVGGDRFDDSKGGR